MEIQNIKQISITDYLQQQGYSPARVQGIHYWYCSPLRNERTPSFKVNTERNQWYDFGSGEHGDIIASYALYIVALSAEPSGF